MDDDSPSRAKRDMHSQGMNGMIWAWVNPELPGDFFDGVMLWGKIMHDDIINASGWGCSAPSPIHAQGLLKRIIAKTEIVSNIAFGIFGYALKESEKTLVALFLFCGFAANIQSAVL